MSGLFVVKAELCAVCDGKGYTTLHYATFVQDSPCAPCIGSGLLDVSSAIPVERHKAGPWQPSHTCEVFVPVESSSSGEGGDQWPEATGDTVRENTEVAPSESVRLVAEAPEGTQPPGLSDGDER